MIRRPNYVATFAHGVLIYLSIYRRAMDFLEDVVLAPYTTFRIGGPARWFAEAATEEDVIAGVVFARQRKLPLFILGGGSNLLVSDQGFAGLVLRIALCGIGVGGQDSSSLFSVGAGEDWDRFVARAVGEDCAGVECLSGIPGTVGGTPVQNVGAYGQEVSETITAVRALDRETLQFVTLPNAECGFAYRQSIFNTSARERYVITRVEYKLEKNGPPKLAYKDLKSYFKDCSPALEEVRIAVRSIRAGKGMLMAPGDPDSRGAGSFFKNPIISVTSLDRIADVLMTDRDRIPCYPAGAGKVKLPAAWLLEQAGFTKGYSLGGAGISTRHSLALVNRDHATAEDVIALRDRIMNTVHGRFGIRLEPEPVWLS
jgi:UDP-N-acetylmuramate dehydrogenase